MTQTARQIGIKTHRENKIVSQFHRHDKIHMCQDQIWDDGTKCGYIFLSIQTQISKTLINTIQTQL